MAVPHTRFDLRLVGGIGTWAVVSAIALSVVLSQTGRVTGVALTLAALQLLFVLAMLVAACVIPALAARPLRLAGFALMALSALAMAVVAPVEFLPIYTIIWMAFAPHLLSRRHCYFALLAILLAWYLLQRLLWQDDGALFQVLLFGTFHFFALQSSAAALRAHEAHQEAQALNQELTATQHLLAEASRQGERTRIARDLHDLLGHHLTALTINLQVAGRRADGELRAQIEHCHALSKLLLADVREAVSTLRETPDLDLREALRITVSDIPRLHIELDIADDVRVDDIDVAQSLLRGVQEAITNTLRHTRATRCWVSLWREDQRIRLRIRDDGVAADPPAWGHGLTGMRERIEKVRGRLRIETVERALQIDVDVPAAA